MDDDDDTDTELEQGGAQPGAEDHAAAMMGEATPKSGGAPDGAADAGAGDGTAELLAEELGMSPEDLSEDGAEATPGEKPDEGAENAEGDGDGNGDGQEKAEGDGDRTEEPKLTPELQAVLDKRIGKEVAKRKAAEEAAEDARSRQSEAEARLQEVEKAERETAAGAQARRLGMDPMFLAETEADLDREEETLWEVERFCEENRDGYVGEGTEEEPQYPASRIRQRLLEVRERRERVLPKAREVLRQRREQDRAATDAYPDLKDPRSEVATEVRRLLRLVPALRAMPNARLLVADMVAGRAARKTAATKKTPPAEPTPGKPRPKPPSTAKPAGPSSVMPKRKTPKGMDEAITEQGLDEEALAELLD